MLDIGHDFKQIHPEWFDTMRVTKLPTFENEFGEDHSTFTGVRQSRLGVRSSTPTAVGELKTIFEFELFGTGADSGQTTFRLRHAWGELGPLGAGQDLSPFSDTDVYPNSSEYRGPTGIPRYRNVQLRYTAVLSDTSNLMFALVRPGASGDQGIYADRIELDGIRPRFPSPDFAAAYKYTADWGYIRTARILRRIHWDDTLDDAFDLSGDATGWGWNVSSNLKAGEGDVLRLQFTVGEGVQNEMNDSPVDIGIVDNRQNAVTPLLGKPVPIVAFSAFLDHTWSEHYTSAIGYAWQDNDNTNAQAPDAFKVGQYALGNLLYTPVPNVMFGGELQWGRRENFSDGFQSDGFKVQFSFSTTFRGSLEGSDDSTSLLGCSVADQHGTDVRCYDSHARMLSDRLSKGTLLGMVIVGATVWLSFAVLAVLDGDGTRIGVLPPLWLLGLTILISVSGAATVRLSCPDGPSVVAVSPGRASVDTCPSP